MSRIFTRTVEAVSARLTTEAMRRMNAAVEVDKRGGVDFVIIDTSAAYCLKDDENSNPQMGAHARMLRAMTKLPGGPCVLVLCHPIKHATDPSQLVPRGGGAFLAEMDGNLTIWRHDDGPGSSRLCSGPMVEPRAVTSSSRMASRGGFVTCAKSCEK